MNTWKRGGALERRRSPESGLFWHDQKGTGYTTKTVVWLFVDILRRAGLKPARGKTGPRIHDLRHSFVVNRMIEWYRAGINPQDKLPFLATYLGHRDIHSTLVYITVTSREADILSPTFTMIQEHRGRMALYHIDLYRLEEAGLDDLGLREYLFTSGVAAVEWFERLREAAELEVLSVRITYVSPSERRIEFVAASDRYEQLLERLRSRFA